MSRAIIWSYVTSRIIVAGFVPSSVSWMPPKSFGISAGLGDTSCRAKHGCLVHLRGEFWSMMQLASCFPLVISARTPTWFGTCLAHFAAFVEYAAPIALMIPSTSDAPPQTGYMLFCRLETFPLPPSWALGGSEAIWFGLIGLTATCFKDSRAESALTTAHGIGHFSIVNDAGLLHNVGTVATRPCTSTSCLRQHLSTYTPGICASAAC